MTKMLNRILGILLSISVIFTGLCFMYGCLSIYKSGDHPYTREIVAQVLRSIIVPILITVILTVISFVYNFAVVETTNSKKPSINSAMLLKNLNSKRDFDNYNGVDADAIHNERRKRYITNVIRTFLIFIGIVLFALYAMNPSNYRPMEEINASMISAIKVLAVCMVIPFIFSVYAAYSNDASMQREIKAMRSILKDVPTKANDVSKCSITEKSAMMIKLVIIVFCVAILLYGLLSGGSTGVFNKAIKICTECIGLG